MTENARKPLTVYELKKILAPLSDDMPVLVISPNRNIPEYVNPRVSVTHDDEYIAKILLID